VFIQDPWVNVQKVQDEYGIVFDNNNGKTQKYDAIIMAVAHKAFKEINIKPMLKKHTVVYDLKATLPDNVVNFRL
jgi:UDP-N-acetyl-D-galactosamine dehydrogenase